MGRNLPSYLVYILRAQLSQDEKISPQRRRGMSGKKKEKKEKKTYLGHIHRRFVSKHCCAFKSLSRAKKPEPRTEQSKAIIMGISLTAQTEHDVPRCLAATSPSPPWFPGPQQTNTRLCVSRLYTFASAWAQDNPANSINYKEYV